MLPQKILKIGSLKTPFSALSGRNMWQNGTENQVIAPILPKYDGQIIEIEEDENRNMCMCNSKYPIQAIFFGL